MLLAVGTSDDLIVCSHLARSLRFLLYSLDNGTITQTRIVERGTDQCGNHRSFTDMLAGCDAVLCGGVGQGAVNALASTGIQTIILARPYRIDEAIAGYVAGNLETTDARVCLCG
jgi:predicted Fe-Mo cluster-binding NifX family protein